MEHQQYQGSDTDVILEYVREGSWTVEQVVASKEGASDDWVTSVNEALSILQQ